MEWAQWWLMLLGVVGAFGAAMSLLGQLTDRLLKHFGPPSEQARPTSGRWL
jgi:hypothetical protein